VIDVTRSFLRRTRVSPSLNPGYAIVVACALLVTGCATPSVTNVATLAAEAPKIPPPDAALAARVLALDCSRVSEADLRDTLQRTPAPRLMLLDGRPAFVRMEAFGEFLVAMGYPEQRIRNPRADSLSYGGFESDELAGTLAWYYERDAMMPVVIGHSRGGMIAVRTLYELDGAYASAIPVRDPATGQALARTTIVDPYTGRERPVVGLKVDYTSAIATGKLPRLLLGQWDMLSKQRRIPDTAVDFTGYTIPFDLIAGDFGDSDPYVATGSAHVRNVQLPASTSHIMLPKTAHLAANPVTHAWIEAYAPGTTAPVPVADGVDTSNIVHAADVWHSLKRNWCREAQRWVRNAHGEVRS
jgi:hypothetical protein